MEISLSCLHKVSNQDVFEYIVDHLVKQNERSMNDARFCCYRYHDRLKCAAGCLISDEEYSFDMEGKLWDELISLGTVEPDHANLIGQLQIIHDTIYPKKGWLKEVRLLGEKELLDVDFMENLDEEMIYSTAKLGNI